LEIFYYLYLIVSINILLITTVFNMKRIGVDNNNKEEEEEEEELIWKERFKTAPKGHPIRNDTRIEARGKNRTGFGTSPRSLYDKD
jgi:hypothetical protein